MNKDKDKRPKVVVQKYENGKPVGKIEVVIYNTKRSKEFMESLAKQPDEDGLIASKS